MYARIQLLVMICSGVSLAVKEKELLQVSLSSKSCVHFSKFSILYPVSVCVLAGWEDFPKFLVLVLHTFICKLAYLMAPITTIAYSLCLVGVQKPNVPWYFDLIMDCLLVVPYKETIIVDVNGNTELSRYEWPIKLVNSRFTGK